MISESLWFDVFLLEVPPKISYPLFTEDRELPKKKSKIIKFSQFLVGYSLGFFAWLAGLHCLEVDAQGKVTLSTKKLLKHLFFLTVPLDT